MVFVPFSSVVVSVIIILFYRYGLGEIPWHVNIAAALLGD